MCLKQVNETMTYTKKVHKNVTKLEYTYTVATVLKECGKYRIMTIQFLYYDQKNTYIVLLQCKLKCVGKLVISNLKY